MSFTEIGGRQQIPVEEDEGYTEKNYHKVSDD
jgi:hypothetical protein